MPVEPDELTPYGTNPAFDLLIMREIQELTFLERMRPYMEGVAKELQAAGVDFSAAIEPDASALSGDRGDTTESSLPA